MLDLHFHPLRKALRLSLNEMALLKEIYELSNNTVHNGWCTKSKAKISETLDLSERNIFVMIETLVGLEYVEKNELGFLRPTDFIRAVAQARDEVGFILKNGDYLLASTLINEMVEKNAEGMKKVHRGMKKVHRGYEKSADEGMKKVQTSKINLVESFSKVNSSAEKEKNVDNSNGESLPLSFSLKKIWLRANPSYPFVDERDLPDLVSIIFFIKNNIRNIKIADDPHFNLKVADEEVCDIWEQLTEKVMQDNFWSKKSIKSISNNIAEFWNKANKNGKRINDEAKINNRLNELIGE